jgi:beta-glucosidase
MNLKEKMGQIVCFFPRKLSEYDELEKDYTHGVGQVSALEMRQLDTLEDASRFQREIQEKVMALSEHKIPAIFHMEGLCGAYVQGATSFPSGIGRGATWDPELEEEIGRVVGRQERAIGISQVFAPVLDISRDSRFGRQGETYGEDPALAAAMGVAYTKGIQSEQTGNLHSECVAKHFLGFHGSDGGIHGAHCDIPARALREFYGKPFQAAISEAGLRGIMPCYASINGEPVSASKEILTGLLREEMGFDGIAVSDYCAIMNIHSVQKVSESFTEAGLRALSAGMDMELHFKK